VRYNTKEKKALVTSCARMPKAPRLRCRQQPATPKRSESESSRAVA